MKFKIILLSFLLWCILVGISYATVEPYKPYLHKAFVPEHPKLLTSGTSQLLLFTGEEQFTYPIQVPQGTNSLQPILELSYESHRASDKQTIVGTGWKITENYIATNVNFTIYNTSDDYYELMLNNAKYDIVYVPSESRFHTKPESFLYIENKTGASNGDAIGRYWVVKTKDGTQYRFGFNTDSALIHNASNAVVARWSLDLINDTHENQIYYGYVENPFLRDASAVYIHKIEYNNDKKRVVNFVYESAIRSDFLQTYESGALINESRRLKEIFITADNSLVRRYVLEYVNISNIQRSALQNITMYGSDNITILPSIKFSYISPSSGWKENSTFNVPATMNFIDATHEDTGVRFADLNRDGFIDMLRAQGNGPHETWLNTGSGWAVTTMWNTSGIVDFVLSNGQDNGVRIDDINNDGLPDMIYASGTTSRNTYINNKTDWLLNTTWNLPSNVGFIDPANGADLGVRLVDINGDGWLDVVKVTTTETIAYLNNGTNTPSDVWQSAPVWQIPIAAAFVNTVTTEDKGVRIADLNHDSYPDLLKGEDATISTWLNMGNGSWIRDPLWDIPIGAAFINGTVEEQGVRITDVNGDKLPDLVQGFSSTLQTWINTANGTWQFNSSWALPDPTVAFVDSAGKNKGVRIVDVNGDEAPDILNQNYSNTFSYINNASKGYLLLNVTYDFGGTETFGYESSTEFNESGILIDSMNFNLWIVTKVTRNNNMTQIYNRTYNYSYGMFDFRQKQFRGFQFVEEKRNETLTKHWFYQDDARAGREIAVSVFNGNGLYQNTSYDWQVVNQNGYNISLLESQTINSWDGTTENRSVNSTFSYDMYGNVLEVNNSGDMAVTGDESYQRFVYVNNTALWIVNALVNHSVYGFNSATLMKRTLYLYDNNALYEAPEKGEITIKEEWSNSSADTITYYGYDSYGNVVQMNDTLNRTMNYTFGLLDTTYTFVDQVENAKGQKTKYYYDLGTGNLINLTDSNNIETNYTYDVFGRITKEIQPYDSDVYPTKEYVYTIDGIAPEKITVLQKETSGEVGTLDTKYYYDGFGNLIQVKTEAENRTLQIVGDIYYDTLDRPIKTSNPYYSNFTADYTTPNASVVGTNYTYDVLDRVTQVLNPDNTRILINFTLWNVTTYNENGKRMDYILDGNGNIIKVTEYIYNGTDTIAYNTTYRYDALNRLVHINDSAGNTFNFTYDSLGRTIQLQDPDMGTWNYTYDALGNLLSQEGSAGELITDQDYYREYNALHQLIRISKGNTTGGQIVEEYWYNPNGDRVKTVRTESGKNTTIYTPFKEWMQIRNSTGTYDFTYIYDENTLIARKNPDNTTWFYHDDHLGSTSLITDENGNIVEETFYTPFGQTTEGGESEAYLLYTNQFKDAVGCYDYGARVYCPNWYHFTSSDPVLQNVYDTQSLNRYSYVRNNPIVYVDPSGRVYWKNLGFATSDTIGGIFIFGTGAAVAGGGAPTGVAIPVGTALFAYGGGTVVIGVRNIGHALYEEQPEGGFGQQIGFMMSGSSGEKIGSGVDTAISVLQLRRTITSLEKPTTTIAIDLTTGLISTTKSLINTLEIIDKSSDLKGELPEQYSSSLYSNIKKPMTLNTEFSTYACFYNMNSNPSLNGGGINKGNTATTIGEKTSNSVASAISLRPISTQPKRGVVRRSSR